jgi:hypothetical protein
MGTEVLEKSFVLPKKTVTVRYINRKKGMAADVKDDHVIAGGMLNGAFKRICTPLMKNGSIMNVLTKEEKDYLENPSTGLGTSLSVYSNRKFWSERYVLLFKGDNLLQLENPIDYIDYKILLANTDLIAPSLKHKDHKMTYMFVVIDEDEEREIEKNTFNYKKQAFKLYSQVENNADILRGIIKMVNKKPVSDKSTIEWLRQEVEKIVDKTPKLFVELIEDSNYEYKIFLSQAEDAGVVIKQNQRYMTTDGIELSEQGEVASFENAVKYIADPKNSELVDILKIKIDKSKK